MDANRGFTLIELMLVVAIIAVLASIAIPAYQHYVAKIQLTAALTDVNGGRSMFEAKLIAEDISSFDPADIGLNANTPRCSAINLVPGITGHIECVVQANPAVQSTRVRITRSTSGVWSCSTGAPIPTSMKPTHCS